jgi:hypothetical protein
VTWVCKARTANMGGNDSQECDWPVCGCDPYADKVIAALQESGVVFVRDGYDKAIRESAANDLLRAWARLGPCQTKEACAAVVRGELKPWEETADEKVKAE